MGASQTAEQADGSVGKPVSTLQDNPHGQFNDGIGAAPHSPAGAGPLVKQRRLASLDKGAAHDRNHRRISAPFPDLADQRKMAPVEGIPFCYNTYIHMHKFSCR
jgi:hypothetical protein